MIRFVPESARVCPAIEDGWPCFLRPRHEAGHRFKQETGEFLARWANGTTAADELARWDVESGVYEAGYTPQPGDTIIDAGAHIGHYTRRAAALVGETGHVYAFEPEPRNFSLLAKSEGDHIMVFQSALWSEARRLPLILGPSTRGTLQPLLGGTPIQGTIEVECVTLDMLLSNLELTRVDLLKIDVEGAEAELLKGARKLINTFIPRLVIEIHPIPVGVADACRELLTDLRYEITPDRPGDNAIWYAEAR